MESKLYLPSCGDFSRNTLWRWYGNILFELSALVLSTKERKFFRDYYFDAGLLKKWRCNYFKQHYIKNFSTASDFLLKAQHKTTVLDLGCGLGTQSLFFALMGAKVIALDLDECALSILQKRVKFYEQCFGRKFDISIHCANALTFDYSRFPSIDAVFSLFAFNLMQPSQQLFQKILPFFSQNVRIAILDGNNQCWRSRVNPRCKVKITGYRNSADRSDLLRIYPKDRINTWSPQYFDSYLIEKGFDIHSHYGGISLPPIAWNLPYTKPLELLDYALNMRWMFPLSHLVMAIRR